MALTFDLDPRQDSTWVQDRVGQITHRKRVRVTGFLTTTFYAMLDELYNDASLPAIGSPLDPLFQLVLLRGWEVVDMSCDSAGNHEMILELQYSEQSFRGGTADRPPDKDGPVVFRQRSFLVDSVVQQDRSNADLVLSYDNDSYIADYTIQRPLIALECERLEEDDPTPRAEGLIGKVNNALWNGYAVRTVLFTDFNADTRDDGVTYFCNYTFVVDPNTWDPKLFYKDEDGVTPGDYALYPGALIQPEIYPQGNFGLLNITLP